LEGFFVFKFNDCETFFDTKISRRCFPKNHLTNLLGVLILAGEPQKDLNFALKVVVDASTNSRTLVVQDTSCLNTSVVANQLTKLWVKVGKRDLM
jgi:hypothetical protein